MKKFRFVLCLMMAALLFCQFALAEAPEVEAAAEAEALEAPDAAGDPVAPDSAEA